MKKAGSDMQLELDKTLVEELVAEYEENKCDGSYWNHLANYLVIELYKQHFPKYE